MQEIRAGDIMLFEGEPGDWIDQTISLITQCPVCHAAMQYTQDSLVEMGLKGIFVNRYQISRQGPRVYQMRLETQPDPTPLVQAARRYVESPMAYNYPITVMLGGYLIFHRLLPDRRWADLTGLLLGAACLELDRWINALLHRGEQVTCMTCSQLVYQCYLDCGEGYRIRLREAAPSGLLGESGMPDTLAGLLEQRRSQGDGPACSKAERREGWRTLGPEELTVLLQELCGVYRRQRQLPPPGNRLPEGLDLSGLLEKGEWFLHRMERLLEELGSPLPVPALFVTPADLYRRAENLRELSQLQLHRLL